MTRGHRAPGSVASADKQLPAEVHPVVHDQVLALTELQPDIRFRAETFARDEQMLDQAVAHLSFTAVLLEGVTAVALRTTRLVR